MSDLSGGKPRFGSIVQAEAGRFRFGADLDGFIARYHHGLARWIEASTGCEQLPEMTGYDGWADWGMTREEFFTAHNAAVEDGLFRHLDPYDGAIDAMWALSDAGVANVIITARLTKPGRHRLVVDQTLDWLDTVGGRGLPGRRHDGRRHGIPYVEPHFTPHKHLVVCDLWGDDAPGNIDAIRAAHGPDSAIVIDRPYNRSCDAPRAKTLTEMAEMVLTAQAHHKVHGTAAGWWTSRVTVSTAARTA